MRFPANRAADNWLDLNNATPQLNGEILVEGPIQIPTFVQQHVQEWADYALSLATPFEEPPPDATDEERREAVETWALFHRLQEADGTINILHPNRAIQEAPPVDTRLDDDPPTPRTSVPNIINHLTGCSIPAPSLRQVSHSNHGSRQVASFSQCYDHAHRRNSDQRTHPGMGT